MKLKTATSLILIALSLSLTTFANENDNVIDAHSENFSVFENYFKNVNFNTDLVNLITLDAVVQFDNNTTKNETNNFEQTFKTAAEKFLQGNITTSYSEYLKMISFPEKNDFNTARLAFRLSDIGFFTISRLSLNNIKDLTIYQRYINEIKEIYFPNYTLTNEEEIMLAEIYADIYYNNLAKESVKELHKKSDFLRKSDYANYILAQAYFESNDYSKSMNAINKALNIKKNSPLYLQYKAKILCETKDYKNALKILDKLDTMHYSLPSFQIGLKIQREFTLASSYKDNAKSKYHLANYFYLMKDYKRATKEINTSIASKKKNYKAYTMLGDIYFIMNDYTKAQDSYQKALSIKKKYSPALLGLGNVTLRAGSNFSDETHKTALNYYENALKYDDSNLEAKLNIAYMYNVMGNKEQAKTLCNDVINVAPNYYRSYYIASNIDDIKKENYLKETLSRNIFYTNAWIDLVQLNINNGTFSEAKINLQPLKALSKDKTKYNYLKNLIEKGLNPTETTAMSQPFFN